MRTVSGQDDQDDEVLSTAEEAELEGRVAESEEAERKGELIPWEALFPPKRVTG